VRYFFKLNADKISNGKIGKMIIGEK